jgi:nucleotide-binding universal stress UspA family protein
MEPEAIESQLRFRSRELTEGAREILDHAGIAHQSHFKLGDAAEAIAEAARSHGCDAIVMGTRGLGAITGWVLGSVARKVLHLTDLPVTLVK